MATANSGLKFVKQSFSKTLSGRGSQRGIYNQGNLRPKVDCLNEQEATWRAWVEDKKTEEIINK